ncbi:hypothetical protein [Micromonospora sp. CA-111912]|uniref:hypothetical protein n=1 Tax=Micromonospora sp. CA-111912 TaxID=3239955 RepID=UPI003D8E14A8
MTGLEKSSARAGAHDRRSWRLRAWNDPGIEQRFLKDSFIAIGGDDMPSLLQWPGDLVVLRTLKTAHPDRGDRALRNFLRYWQVFRLHMRAGDVVVVPLTGSRAAIGEVTADYGYAEDATEPRLHHWRPVAWLGVVRRDALDRDLRRVVNAPGTVCLFRAPAAAERLVAFAQSDPSG